MQFVVTPDLRLYKDGSFQIITNVIKNKHKEITYFLFNEVLVLVAPDKKFFNSVASYKVVATLKMEELFVKPIEGIQVTLAS